MFIANNSGSLALSMRITWVSSTDLHTSLELQLDVKLAALIVTHFCNYAVLALALGRVGSLPRASGLRGPHSSKKGPLQAVLNSSVHKVHYEECYSSVQPKLHSCFLQCSHISMFADLSYA